MLNKPVIRISIVVLALFVCLNSISSCFAEDKKEVKNKSNSVLEIETTGIAGANDALVLLEDDITEEVEKQYSDNLLEKVKKEK